MAFETSGSLTTATKTADGTAVEITTDATVPTDTSISLTVKQDESGGTTADNTETISVSDGTNTTALSNFTNTTGSSWWLTIDLSTTDDTVSPTFNSATLTVEQAVTVGVDTVSLGFSVQDAFIAPEKKILRADPVSLGFAVESPQTISAETIIQPEPVTLGFDVQNALIAPFLLTDEWRIGDDIFRPTGVEATPQTTRVSLSVPADEIDIWRGYEQSGDLTTNTGFGGAFRSFSRDSDGSISVRPAFAQLQPFQPEFDYQVSAYDETQVAPNRFEVSLTLQRSQNRGEAFQELSQTGDWEFDLAHGTIGLANDKVSQADRSGAAAGATISLRLRVTGEQAGALLDSLGSPGAITTRNIPDGDNVRVDELDGGQSVTILSPSDSVIDDETYAVPDWALAYDTPGESPWLFDMTLAKL